uniref:Uncharacterized protein n=1 Tax=Sphaerodactylus townsendi TaxID=933632 RepID=A0ACB8G9U3_9SAUR
MLNIIILSAFIQVENDYLFDKGQANFWAEKLTHARLLHRHLLLLIPVNQVSPCDQEKLQQLTRSVSDQAQRVTQLLKEMPPVPEFSQSIEFTKLVIQKERISICLNILTLLDAGSQACKKQERVAEDNC